MKDKEISRRALIAGAAVAAAALAVVPGCSGGDEIDPQEGWLPIGSVVEVDREDGTTWKIMIVQRKPMTLTVVDEKTGKARAWNENDRPFDYAGVVYPYGVMADFSDGLGPDSFIFFERSQISKVLLQGYSDKDEETCERMLTSEDTDGHNLSSSTLFSDMYASATGEKGDGEEDSSEDGEQ